MLSVKRKKPSGFFLVESHYAKLDVEKFYSRSIRKRRQEEFDFRIHRQLEGGILKDLSSQFSGKCAYCDRRLSNKEVHTIDRFRPANGARGFDKRFDREYYWWLAYEWSNLYLACRQCNKFKSLWFPVEGDRCEIGVIGDALKRERNLLLDPCADRPEQHLQFDNKGLVHPNSERGDVTIRILQLNRNNLVSERRKAMNDFIRRLDRIGFRNMKNGKFNGSSMYKLLDVLSNTSFEFMTMKRQYLANHILYDQVYDFLHRGRLNRRDYPMKILNFWFAKTRYPKMPFVIRRIEKKKPELNRAYIEKIVIKNFKSISSLTLDFPGQNSLIAKRSDEGIFEIEHPQQESWMMILGENSVGKSSILQAVTLAFGGQKYISQLKIQPDKILRHDSKNGFVKVFITGIEKPLIVSFNSETIKASSETPAFYFLAYGSTRIAPVGMLKPERSSHKLIRAKNLFNPGVSLINPEKWLLGIKRQSAFDLIARDLKRLLLLNQKDKILRDKGKIRIAFKSGQRPTLEELSDGYKSVIVLVIDIMEKLSKEGTSMEGAEGVVLIDEIGTHLHPRWRMRIVDRLRKVFPHVQFIVTTHDPLCLKGLGDKEVIVLKRTDRGRIYMPPDLPNPGALRADQLLASDFFGLSSTIDPATEDAFDEYYKLKGKRVLTKIETEKLKQLKVVLRDKKQLGENRREELMYEAIDRLIAKSHKLSLKDGVELKERTMKRIEKIWDDSIISNVS